MKRIAVQWHGPRSSEALRRLLVQGRTFALLSIGSMLFFVLAGLAGMAHRQAATSPVSSMRGIASAVSGSLFAEMLGMELPAMKASDEPTGLSAGSAASFVVRLLTDVNPADPKSLVAREMPGLADERTVLLRPGSGGSEGTGPADNRPLPGGEDAEPDGQPGGAAAGGGAGTDDGAAAGEPGRSGGTDDGRGTAAGGENDGQSGGADDGAGGEEPSKPTTGGRQVVFIYHSHPRESWFPELKEGAKDANSAKTNITLVGKRLAEKLSAGGVGAQHDATDYPTAIDGYRWELSYKYSKETVTEAMAGNGDLQFFFDLHRDSQPRQYTTATIDGKDYAQVYFIIGHRNPQWRENEAFATRIHEALEQKYPGISRGIWGKDAASGNGEYNQSLSPESVIIEIGGIENTLEESYRTADALAEVITDIYWAEEEAGGQPAGTQSKRAD